mgnify:CR=1 FL=1
MWFGVYDPVTGELRSIGTEAMFVERARPKGDEYNGLRIAEFGDDVGKNLSFSASCGELVEHAFAWRELRQDGVGVALLVRAQLSHGVCRRVALALPRAIRSVHR